MSATPICDPASTRRPAVAWPWIVAIALLVVLLAVYPPFRVVSARGGAAPVASGGAPAGQATFDAAAYAAAFWTGQLQPAAAAAAALQPILIALRQDPVAAARANGRQVGIGGSVYYFVRAEGRVVAIERSRLLVAVDGLDGATVALRTGPVFGNTVRDGCGLLEVNRVPGLQEFNAISAELNRLVEERVQPGLGTGIAVGTRLAFAGCAEAPEKVGEGPLLSLIPVRAEVLP